MKTLLETIQNTWDELDKKDELDESFKEKYPRPETLEDAQKLLNNNTNKGCVSSLMFLLLLFMFTNGLGFSNSEPQTDETLIN